MIVAEAPTRTAEHLPVDGVAPDQRPVHVLVIEDQPDIRTLVRFMLRATGIQVTAVGDGRSALDMIQSWPAPNAIVLDRMLPFVDGDELIRRIRAEPSWSKVPIIVISARAQEHEIAQTLQAGANEYVVKPFTPTQLRSVLQRYLPRA